MLAYLTVIGFVVRGVWAISGSALGQQKVARVLPHLIDTLLLALGITMAIQLGLSLTSGWLAAKLVGLCAYIGFGVLTLRARSKSLQLVGFTGALLSVGYIFSVAFSRSAWPY